MALSDFLRRVLGIATASPAAAKELADTVDAVTATGSTQSNTNISTAGAGTLSAAGIVGGIITRTGPTGNFSDGTDTAAAIIAALPAGAFVNQSWNVWVINNTPWQQTVTNGSGVTLTGLSPVIPANSTSEWLVTYTGAGAVTMQLVETVYDNAGGADPSTILTQFGSAAAGSTLGQVREEGNVYAAAGNPLGANGADTTDDILGGIRIPASCLDVAGRQLLILASGQTGSTNNNKRFKIFLNPTMSGQTLTNGVYSNAGTVTAGTPICDSGAWVNGTTPNNNVGWQGVAQVTKYGALNADTQIGQASAILGGTHGGVQAQQALTLDEDATIDIVVTGSSYTTGAANDIKLGQLTVTASN